MKIKILNPEKNKILVLIHGGNSSFEEWDEYLEYFQNYCLYLVSISGHGDDFENDYTSIKENAKSICDFIKNRSDNCYVFGRGLGAQIALEMIQEEPTLIKKVIFESLSCCYLGLLKTPIRISAKLRFKEDEEAVNNKKQLTKAKFKKMVNDNTSFVLDARINNFSNKAYLMYSSNDDKFFKKSADLLKEYIKDIEIKTYTYGHLFGLTYVKEIINDILNFLSK